MTFATNTKIKGQVTLKTLQAEPGFLLHYQQPYRSTGNEATSFTFPVNSTVRLSTTNECYIYNNKNKKEKEPTTKLISILEIEEVLG